MFFGCFFLLWCEVFPPQQEQPPQGEQDVAEEELSAGELPAWRNSL